MKDEKAKTVLYGFIGIVNEYKCKPKKLWVDQPREFYNSVLKKWLNDNILMYSTHNEVILLWLKELYRVIKLQNLKLVIESQGY